ncbi:phosphotransferase [Arthrobacter flavus]|uniref:Phosphotransferase n=1 Tax=Arthrobacter flavus TaxID=95172 RepID=A0ABW4QB49_9MICC
MIPTEGSAGIDYTRTARRAPWATLPAAVSDRIAAELGSPPETVTPAGGGFTNGFAAVVGAGNRSLFAKAAPATNHPIFAAYVREAEVLAALPANLPFPLLHFAELIPAAGTQWQLLCFEAIDGYMPGQPWTATDLGAVHRSLLTVQSGLQELPTEFSGGSMVDDFFGADSQTGVSDCWLVNDRLPSYLSPLKPRQMAELQDLTLLGRDALVGDAVLHNDLRADNILIRSNPRSTTEPVALFCDWNFLSTGPAWADWVALLVYPRHAGIDVGPWLTESPLSADADPEHIDAWLAVLAAYMVTSGSQPDLATSPFLRTHQRFTARILIDWISERRHWEF